MHPTAGQCNAVKKGSLRDTVQCIRLQGSVTKEKKAVQKKSSAKHINMGSTFEDLDATSTPVKSDSYLSTWIVSYFNFRIQL